jgi:hypothetical protein
MGEGQVREEEGTVVVACGLRRVRWRWREEVFSSLWGRKEAQKKLLCAGGSARFIWAADWWGHPCQKACAGKFFSPSCQSDECLKLFTLFFSLFAEMYFEFEV